jgi:hypothetical protein
LLRLIGGDDFVTCGRQRLLQFLGYQGRSARIDADGLSRDDNDALRGLARR